MHAKVFDHYYGTPRGPVDATLAQGRDVLFDIDWQGTQQVAEKARGDLVSIFIFAAVDGRARPASAQPSPRQRGGDHRTHGPRRRRDDPLERVRLCGGERRF